MALPQRRNFFLRHPSVLALGLVLALVMGKIPITHGGFYCDDASIGFKRTPHETFDTNLLIAICILPLMAVFLVGEYLCLERYLSSELSSESDRESAAKIGKWRVAWRAATRIYGDYWTCAAFNLLANEILKTAVAEPRPHFLETCKPEWDSIDCTQNNGFVSFSESLCTANNTANSMGRSITDAMRSFPSGHAQLSAFTAIFAIIYLQIRVPTTYSNYMKHVLQLAFVAFTVAASVTRVSDKRHHWWDVAAGDSFGAIFAYLATRIRCDSFSEDWTLLLGPQKSTIAGERERRTETEGVT